MSKITAAMKITKIIPSTDEGNCASEQAEVKIYYRGIFNLPFFDRIFLNKDEWLEIGKAMKWK